MRGLFLGRVFSRWVGSWEGGGGGRGRGRIMILASGIWSQREGMSIAKWPKVSSQEKGCPFSDGQTWRLGSASSLPSCLAPQASSVGTGGPGSCGSGWRTCSKQRPVRCLGSTDCCSAPRPSAAPLGFSGFCETTSNFWKLPSRLSTAALGNVGSWMWPKSCFRSYTCQVSLGPCPWELAMGGASALSLTCSRRIFNDPNNNFSLKWWAWRWR